MPSLTGILFDCYADHDGWVVWIIADDGQRLRLIDHSWAPSFFLHGPRDVLKRTIEQLLKLHIHIQAQWTTRKELFYDRPMDVLQVFVQRPLLYQKAVNRLTRTMDDDRIQIFNCDFSLPSSYFFERRLFPTARVELTYGRMGVWAYGRDESVSPTPPDAQTPIQSVPPIPPHAHTPTHIIHSIKSLDDPWDTDYPSIIEQMRVLELRLACGKQDGTIDYGANPKHQPRGTIELTYDGLTHTLESESPRELIEDINQILNDYDPDVLLTDYGDSFLFPQLLAIARNVRVPLRLHREECQSNVPHRFPRIAEPTGRVRSYVQYGRIVYQPASYTFRGRWHVDRQNCFLWREGEWEGLLEIARVAKLPVQHMSRTSVGRGITSMQLETLHRDGYLVPWRKREPEDFKTADELITADKGGLVFQPLVGFHENVAEIDFASMYPALMVAQNISPETVNCRCCETKRVGVWASGRLGETDGVDKPAKTVPELGYRICERREGFVTKTLRPLLEKRAKYKQLRDSSPIHPHAHTPTPSICDSRQSALKWLLVVCFGYLGYKNARFGRIEAHESTTAWSREILLQAKEIAESRGFEMIHAIVDCIWVHKEGATVEDYQTLSRTVAELTEIPTTLEGVYRWLRFVPSVTNPRIGVPNRYVGVFQNGKTKVRGLALRRHDTPRFIKNVQQHLINHFARAKNLVEYHALIPEAQKIVDEAISDIRSGLLDYQDVAIFRSISQPPEMYQKATVSATVAKELTRRGVKLHAGEGIEYVITDAKHKIPEWRAKAAAGIDTEWSYDPQYYVELLLKACGEVFTCQSDGSRITQSQSEPRP